MKGRQRNIMLRASRCPITHPVRDAFQGLHMDARPGKVNAPHTGARLGADLERFTF